MNLIDVILLLNVRISELKKRINFVDCNYKRTIIGYEPYTDEDIDWEMLLEIFRDIERLEKLGEKK